MAFFEGGINQEVCNLLRCRGTSHIESVVEAQKSCARAKNQHKSILPAQDPKQNRILKRKLMGPCPRDPVGAQSNKNVDTSSIAAHWRMRLQIIKRPRQSPKSNRAQWLAASVVGTTIASCQMARDGVGVERHQCSS